MGSLSDVTKDPDTSVGARKFNHEATVLVLTFWESYPKAFNN